ncbi:hypothetical protein EHM69_03375 [candidate division KSB1 bacterium]|nr:MAG: hypothetical protein EHM69_03375 [candidate division KSB1 bacterium]
MDIIPSRVLPLDTNKVASLKDQTDPARKLHAQAEQAAEQFETMLAQQMIRSMQSSLDNGNMFGAGTAGDIYNGLAEWELARIITRSGNLGVKEQILRQLPKEEEKAK